MEEERVVVDVQGYDLEVFYDSEPDPEVRERCRTCGHVLVHHRYVIVSVFDGDTAIDADDDSSLYAEAVQGALEQLGDPCVACENCADETLGDLHESDFC